jgi:hypothetical protein
MDYLYSLYDALVSINVPGDKARAVVDAMERDMGTTLATKQDLLLLKQDLLLLASKEDHLLLKQDVALLRQEMTNLRTELRQEIANRYTLLVQMIDTVRADVARDLAALELRMTVKLGSMMFVGFGATIAALRSWL